MTSAHTLLHALDQAEILAPTLPRFWLLPDFDDSTSKGWFVQGTETERTIIPAPFDVDLSLVKGDGVLAISFSYLDASSDTFHAKAFIKGTFTYNILCHIATALTSDTEACFIPEQIDLEGLLSPWRKAHFLPWKDVVWHDLTGLAMLSPNFVPSTARDLDTWLPTVMHRAKNGYDHKAALETIAKANNTQPLNSFFQTGKRKTDP